MMNDKLKNLNIEPDAEVWTRLNGTLRRKAIAKYAAIAASAVVVAGAAIMLWPSETALPEQEQIVASVNETAVAAEVSAMSNNSEATEMTAAPKAAAMPSSIIAFEDVDYNDEPTGEPFQDRYEAPKAAEQKAAVEQVSIKPAKPVVAPEAKESMEEQANMAPEQAPAAKMQKASTSDGIRFWTPTVFAPNGDVDENRVFKVVPTEDVANYCIEIFDRGGHKVFESRDYIETWNGTYKGQLLPQSAYVYVIHYTDHDGKAKSKRGTVTLIR